MVDNFQYIPKLNSSFASKSQSLSLHLSSVFLGCILSWSLLSLCQFTYIYTVLFIFFHLLNYFHLCQIPIPRLLLGFSLFLPVFSLSKLLLKYKLYLTTHNMKIPTVFQVTWSTLPSLHCYTASNIFQLFSYLNFNT